MQARIKQDARYGVLSFFSGHEFTKREWRDVPAGHEAEAQANEWLDTRDGEPIAANVVEISAPAGVEPVIAAQAVDVIETINTATNDAPKETETAGRRNRHGGK